MVGLAVLGGDHGGVPVFGSVNDANEKVSPFDGGWNMHRCGAVIVTMARISGAWPAFRALIAASIIGMNKHSDLPDLVHVVTAWLRLLRA